MYSRNILPDQKKKVRDHDWFPIHCNKIKRRNSIKEINGGTFTRKPAWPISINWSIVQIPSCHGPWTWGKFWLHLSFLHQTARRYHNTRYSQAVGCTWLPNKSWIQILKSAVGEEYCSRCKTVHDYLYTKRAVELYLSMSPCHYLFIFKTMSLCQSRVGTFCQLGKSRNGYMKDQHFFFFSWSKSPVRSAGLKRHIFHQNVHTHTTSSLR